MQETRTVWNGPKSKSADRVAARDGPCGMVIAENVGFVMVAKRVTRTGEHRSQFLARHALSTLAADP